jgi:2-polyprenyl-3-methyl-5-hydroxy-6-metoxy-1,4-benzoquinol methylase
MKPSKANGPKERKVHSNVRRAADPKVLAMERLNTAQKDYYEADGGDLSNVGNIVTKSWTRIRGRVAKYRTEIGVKSEMRRLHYQWLGDLTGCRVMELGCASGNSVSRYLAEHADSYLGVDLNAVGVAKLKATLSEYGLSKGDAVAADFLSSDFEHGPFDVIYAQGVLHHFQHFDAFLKVLHSRLSPGGRVVAFDPIQTALIPRMVRAAYRPFQSDADWEWPFTKKSFLQIEEHFEIQAMQGLMGWSKWPILLLPFSFDLAVAVGRPLHARDLRFANQQNRSMWRCMNVATLLVRKDSSG